MQSTVNAGEWVYALLGGPRVLVGKVISADNDMASLQTYIEPAVTGPIVSVDVSSLVSLLSLMSDASGPMQGNKFNAGQYVLERVAGGFQLAKCVHDVPEGTALPTIRLYVPHGATVVGVTTSCPIEALFDPREFLAT